MPMQIVEMSSAPINGRRIAKLILHEIFPDDGSRWQKNGISWTRQNTEDNLHTAEGMSITVEFVDSNEKREPFGHGFNGVMPDGKLDFSDAVMVGYAYSPKIETLEINGKYIEALTVQASLDEHRYPLFIDWLFSEISQGKTIAGSVEIVGRNKGEEIEYEGGWKEVGRIPSRFSYSGYALLGIESADPSAVLIELNAAESKNLKEDVSMTPKEIQEALANEFKMLADKIAEVNSKDESAEVENLVKEIADLKADLAKVQAECNTAQTALEAANTEKENLSTKLADAENRELISELNASIAQFTEEQRAVAKDQIAAFMKKPEKSEINTIVANIKVAYADQKLAEAKSMTEQNSHDDNRFDYSMNSIFGPVEDTFKTIEGEVDFY